MSAASVRAGGAFVEITANDTQFQRTLKKTQHSIVRLQRTLQRGGTAMAVAGGVMGLPMLAAARSAATFQDALLELKGATSGMDSKQLSRVREEALRLSKALGVAPEAAAQAFTLLIKAGMSVEDALGGAAKTAIEFARISGVEAAAAAEFMKVAMNVFGISAQQAANTLSAAADSSETTIAAMTESFSLVASVAKGTNQSLFGLSEALAVLARYGIKGEEGGTGLKTLLIKLLAPTKEAKAALEELGLTVESFFNKQGKLLPVRQIAMVFEKALAGLSKTERKARLAKESLVKIFDVRGIRVIEGFVDAGEKGFNAVADQMEEARTVAEKFKIAQEGLTGIGLSLMAAVKRLAIAFADGYFTGALRGASNAAIVLMDSLSWMLSAIPVLSPILAGSAGALFGVGLAAIGAGGLLQVVNFALRGFITLGPVATNLSRAFGVAISGLSKVFVELGSQIAKTNIAQWVANVGQYISQTQVATFVTGLWTKAVDLLTAAFGRLGFSIAAIQKLGIVGAAAVVAGLLFRQGLAISEARSNAVEERNRQAIRRDPKGDPLGRPGATPSTGLGESAGTFSAAAATRLGIGPALTAAQETADNTGRTADAVEELASNARTIPQGAALQAGIAAGVPVVAGGVAARSDRDLLSANERAALAAEKQVELLRRLIDMENTVPAFA
jgi:TP901 family phage tail tape measure protein